MYIGNENTFTVNITSEGIFVYTGVTISIDTSFFSLKLLQYPLMLLKIELMAHITFYLDFRNSSYVLYNFEVRISFEVSFIIYRRHILLNLDYFHTL